MTYKNNLYVNLSSLLIYLLPLALLTGPFISDLIVTFLAISFICYVTLENKFNFFNNNFFYYLAILYFILIISSFNSDYVLFSLKSSATYIRHIFFIMLVLYLMLLYE